MSERFRSAEKAKQIILTGTCIIASGRQVEIKGYGEGMYRAYNSLIVGQILVLANALAPESKE